MNNVCPICKMEFPRHLGDGFVFEKAFKEHMSWHREMGDLGKLREIEHD